MDKTTTDTTTPTQWRPRARRLVGVWRSRARVSLTRRLVGVWVALGLFLRHLPWRLLIVWGPPSWAPQGGRGRRELAFGVAFGVGVCEGC